MKKKLIVIQDELSDCGACSLLSIIRYYQGNVSLEQLRLASNTTKEGVTALNLINCAKRYGFEAIGIKNDYIEKNNLPCIAHLNINKSLSHFVVIYKINNNVITVMNPSIGEQKMDITKFYDMFSGFAIYLHPKNFIPNHIPKNILKHNYISFYKRNIKQLLLIIFLNISISLLAIIYSLRFSLNKNLVTCLLLFLLIVFKCLFELILKKVALTFNKNLNRNMLNDFFFYIFKLPLKYLHIKDANEIIKRADDIEDISDIYTPFLINFLINVLALIPVLIILGRIDCKVLLLSLLFMIVYFLFNYIHTNKIRKYTNDIIETNTEYKQHLIDLFKGLISINHANAQKICNSALNNFYDNYNNADKNFEFYIGTLQIIKRFIYNILEIILYIFYLKVFSSKHVLNWTNFMSLNFLLGFFFEIVNELANIIPIRIYINNVINRLNDFYNIDTLKEQTGKYHGGDIIFCNVYFSYNSYKNILVNKDLIIKYQEKIMLYGKSGQGKTTICKLLYKEYTNYKGTIMIGDKDLKNISTEEIRKNITYSSQNEHIFMDTIRNNILMGKRITEENFLLICNMCCLDSIIVKRPFGYDTFLFGGGEELSGGERQRIIMARALCSLTDIYIFDETLSEVDNVLENKIIENVLDYLKNKTVIYITHKDKKQYFDRVLYV